jgi:hypothetical protein
MKSGFIKSIIFLLGIIVLGLSLAPFLKSDGKEGFESSKLLPGDYPVADDKPILDSFPLTGNIDILKGANSGNKWTDNSVGSFKQITNNPKYPDSPDNGSCTPIGFCDVLYKGVNNNEKNIAAPVKPAEEGDGARVNYYRTEPNLLFYSIPTNENILY